MVKARIREKARGVGAGDIDFRICPKLPHAKLYLLGAHSAEFAVTAVALVY